MSDLTAKLMELLSDRENMEKIQSLSSLINGSMEDSDDNSTSSQEQKCEKHSEPAPQEGDGLSLDAIQTVMRLAPLLSSLNKDDENTRLLCALRPLLSARRQAKLDESMKMLQMFKLLPLLRSQGLF